MRIASGGMTACPDDDLYIDMNIYGSAAVSSVAEYPANIAAVSGSALGAAAFIYLWRSLWRWRKCRRRMASVISNSNITPDKSAQNETCS